MKKIVSAALCLCMAAAVLASCAQKSEPYVSPRITVSSSAAEDSAVWLTNRLGNSLSGKIVLAVGDSANGIDMTNFEDDGFVIRADGSSTVIASKTETGMDAAVRRYANAVDTGKADDLDVVYHEGYRIERLTLAGNDISEYKIEYPAEHNENMMFAVSEFTRLVKQACGADLTASEGITSAAKVIEFRHSTDAELKDDGYRYFFEGDRFVIEGAVKRGCMYGVWRFLQNECGWLALGGYGQTMLLESDHIDIPADINKSETLAFQFIEIMHQDQTPAAARFTVDRNSPNLAQRSYGAIPKANHGFQNYNWGGYNVVYLQICYTNENVFYNVKDSIIRYIDDRLASGSVIGWDFLEVDIAQGDNGSYCRCTECMKVAKEENGATSGAVVRFANRMDDEISENEEYEGLAYLIYAYMGTQPPCKTRVNHDVRVTYAPNGCCSAHKFRGGECVEKHDLYAVTDLKIVDNNTFADWLRGWCDICDNVYIWDYLLEQNLQTYTVLDNLYDDMKFFFELGVQGIFFNSDNQALSFNHLNQQLAFEMFWNPDMTREEYDRLAEKSLELYYGDGWMYIEEYIDILQKAQDLENECWDCWGFASSNGDYDPYYMAEMSDCTTELIERAIETAVFEDQRVRCEILSASVYYQGCYSSFFKAYDDGDEARLNVLRDRYSLAMERLKSAGYNLESFTWPKLYMYEKLDDEAWNKWVEQREDTLPHGETVRPAPPEYSNKD